MRKYMIKKIILLILVSLMAISCTPTKETLGECAEGCEIAQNDDITLDSVKWDVLAFDEAYEFIKEKNTGLLFFSFKDCPYCKVAKPVLEDISEDYPFVRTYYVDVERTEREKGQETYDNIYELFEPYLKEELGEDNEKMFVPYFVWVDNGKIVKTHTGTVDGSTELTPEQMEKLYQIFREGYSAIENNKKE